MSSFAKPKTESVAVPADVENEWEWDNSSSSSSSSSSTVSVVSDSEAHPSLSRLMAGVKLDTAVKIKPEIEFRAEKKLLEKKIAKFNQKKRETVADYQAMAKSANEVTAQLDKLDEDRAVLALKKATKNQELSMKRAQLDNDISSLKSKLEETMSQDQKLDSALMIRARKLDVTIPVLQATANHIRDFVEVLEAAQRDWKELCSQDLD